MAGVNKVILLGNLGGDPEVRTLENGNKVANFNIATSESYKDRNTGERITQTEWHRIVMWRGLAEIAEKYLHKGDQIYVEGKIQTRNYQDKDGVTRYTTEIVVSDMTMLGKRDMSQAPAGQSTEQKPQAAADTSRNGHPEPQLPEADEEDDLPF